MSRISVPKGAANFRGRKSNSLMNLCGKKILPILIDFLRWLFALLLRLVVLVVVLSVIGCIPSSFQCDSLISVAVVVEALHFVLHFPHQSLRQIPLATSSFSMEL